jgi:pimeloyl-ACP methyl ester carboxylesterase
MLKWLSYLFMLYNGVSKNNKENRIEISPNNTWFWKDKITYSVHIEKHELSNSKTSIVLLHGFGASTFHWRENIPELSKTYNVYAMDLLGFGKSDKPLSVEYTPELWRNQTVAFVKKIYHDTGGKPVVLVGNSLGGYTAVYSAVDTEIKKMIHSVILLNPVGLFRGKELPFSPSWFGWILQPAVFRWMFHFFQSQIKEILQKLYPHHPERVDQALVDSILQPSQEPNAREVFCKIMRKQLTEKHPYMEDLLCQFTVPLCILMGKDDPWMMPHLYSDFLKNCPTAFGKELNAGHCPHDEIPNEVNKLILLFLSLTE